MKSASRVERFLDRFCDILWAIALICLPFTSFPLLASLSGGLVAPLSILPFFVLLILWTLPLIIRKGELPKESVPLLAFTLVAIISCAVAYFFFIPGFKGKTVSGQEIRSLFTLAVGLVFFFVTATWIKNTDRLKTTLKYITIGGVISLIWAGVQEYYILHQANVYPFWVEQIQFRLVVHSPSFYPQLGRVSGLAYEASWFAHQMVVIYLPIWFAATYYRISAFSFKLFRITVENILLVFGLVAFFISSPRIGLVSLLLVVLYLFIRLNYVLHRKIVERISISRAFQKSNAPGNHKSLIQAITSFSIVVVYIFVIAGVFFLAVQRDWRLSALVSAPPTIREIVGVLTLDQNTLLELSHRFLFLERMVYWLNGWNIFNQYPWLGVGLGNAGFFFPKFAPPLGWATFEIRSVLFYLAQLPNVKSIWFRLLAETGLVGFTLYLTWYYILYQSSRFSQHHHDNTIKAFGFAGQLALLAFIGEGFSIDSFAMPYIWVIAGLIAGIAMMYRREIKNKNTSG